MQWLTVSAVFVVAALVQAVTGVGYALLAAPILLMVAPSLVPVPLLLTGLVILTSVVIRDHDSIDLRALAGALIASFPGAAVGVGAMEFCPSRVVTLVTSGAITVLAGLALVGRTIRTTRWSMAGAGFCAGAMGSIAGMSGPPMALVYRPRNAVILRTNLSLSFLVMGLFSIGLLYAGGLGTLHSLVTAARYLPAVAVGLIAARVLSRYMRGSVISRAVLWIALLSGASLLVRTLAG